MDFLMNHETVVSESAVSGFMFTHCVLLRTVIIGLLNKQVQDLTI